MLLFWIYLIILPLTYTSFVTTGSPTGKFTRSSSANHRLMHLSLHFYLWLRILFFLLECLAFGFFLWKYINVFIYTSMLWFGMRLLVVKNECLETVNWSFRSVNFSVTLLFQYHVDTVNLLLFAVSLFSDLLQINWFATTNVSEPTLFRPNEMTRTGFVARNIRDEEAHANHTKISRTWIKIWFTVPFAWYICAMNLWKSNKSVGYKLTTLIDMKMVCVCVKFYTWNILNWIAYKNDWEFF